MYNARLHVFKGALYNKIYTQKKKAAAKIHFHASFNYGLKDSKVQSMCICIILVFKINDSVALTRCFLSLLRYHLDEVVEFGYAV